MTSRFGFVWRTAATGICFAAFGVGGIILRLVVFPVLDLVVPQRERRVRLARSCIHHAFRLFVALMRWLQVLTYEVRGADRLRREGLLIVANHPTLIDTVFLISLVRRADCIVKATLAHNAFTQGPVRAAGYVCNDSGADMVHDCIASVRAGNNLIIFPEGTRTARSGDMTMHRGAANVAVRGLIDVTPVRIRVQPMTLGKGEPWYRVPARRVHLVFDVGEDIPVRAYLGGGVAEAVAARRLTAHFHDYFSMETTHAEPCLGTRTGNSGTRDLSTGAGGGSARRY
jgi:1-acyl-sn-glycerol-3-phosphate acyltransferase